MYFLKQKFYLEYGVDPGAMEGGIDMDPRQISLHQLSIQVEDVNFGFLQEGEDMVLPNLQDEEISSRRKACTMVEVDLPPRVVEEWSFGEDPLPRLTDQEIRDAENLLSDENVQEPPGFLQTFEEPPVLDDVAVMAPPIKPKNGSNPRIDVTLAPVDERALKRLSTTPMDVAEQVNDEAESQIPQPVAAVDTIEDPTVDPREGVVIEPTEEDVVPQDAADQPVVVVNPPEDSVIQPPVMEQDPSSEPSVTGGKSSLELGSLSSPDERPKKKRKLGVVWFDMETQIPSNVMKTNQEDYSDLLRSQTTAEDMVEAKKKKPKQSSGVRLGTSLHQLFRDALHEAQDFGEGRYDWEVVDHDIAVAPNLTVEEEVSGMRDGSVNIPEAGISHSESNFNPDLHSTALAENPEGLLNKEPTLGNIVEEDHLPLPVLDHQVTPPPIAVPDHEDPGDEDHNSIIPRTPGQVREQSEVGFQPPSPPKILEESVNYEEFSRGLQLAETRNDEGFNETLDSVSIVDHLRMAFGGQKKGRFQSVVSGETERMKVAKLFFQTLVANKEEKVELTQDECYEDMYVEIL